MLRDRGEPWNARRCQEFSTVCQTRSLHGHIRIEAAGDSAVDDGLLLLVQQRDQLPLCPNEPVNAPVRVVEEADDGRLIIRRWQRQPLVAKHLKTEIRRPFPNAAGKRQDPLRMRHLADNVRVIVRHNPRTWLAYSVHRGALSIAVRYADGTSKGIHCVDDEITTPYSLIPELEYRLRESTQSPILPKRHHSIAEARDHIVLWSNWPVHPIEEPFRPLCSPVRGQPRHPWKNG